MKKLLFVLGSLVIIGFGSQVALAQDVNTYPSTTPEDAAKINDIQGQVNSSYFQNNSLRQDATGVSQNPDGSANLLKNSTDQQTIKVTGPVPTEDNASTNNDVPVFGLLIFLAVMIAPIVLIINMLRNNKKQIVAQPAEVGMNEPYSQEDEDLTEAQLAELKVEESTVVEETKDKPEEPVEKIKKEVKKKSSKKSKKKSKKKKKK